MNYNSLYIRLVVMQIFYFDQCNCSVRDKRKSLPHNGKLFLVLNLFIIL